jgi:phosphatidylglycerophosphate synthase
MDDSLDHIALKRLRISTLFLLLVWLVSLLLLAGLFWQIANHESVLSWLEISIAAGLVFLAFLWIALPENRYSSYGMLQFQFGLANTLSILRGLILMGLVGYIVVPYRHTNLELIPGAAFLAALILDAADGVAARMLGQITRLGENLDRWLDFAALLIGTSILVAQYIIPRYFMLICLAYLLLAVKEWLFFKRMKPLQPSQSQRMMINLSMGLIGMGLLPVYSSGVISTASIFILFALVAVIIHGFLIDCEVLPEIRRIRKPDTYWYDLFLLVIRLAAAGLMMFSPSYPTDFSSFLPGFLLTMTAIVGFLPRLGMMGILLITGSLLSHPTADGLLWVSFILAASSLILGAGSIALWTPEDNWLMNGFKGGNASE